MNGTYYALCEVHRLLPDSRLDLNWQDVESLYHRIHPRVNGKGA